MDALRQALFIGRLVVPAMCCGLPLITLMVVLAVIFVSAGNFLFFCLLPLLGDLVHKRRFRSLLLLIEVLVLLCHLIILTKVMCDGARQPGSHGILSFGSNKRFIDRPLNFDSELGPARLAVTSRITRRSSGPWASVGPRLAAARRLWPAAQRGR